jgi:hypothetical protein
VLEPLLRPLGKVDVVRLDELTGLEPETDSLPPSTPEQQARGRKLVADAVAAHGGLERIKGVSSSLVDAGVRVAARGVEVNGTLRQLRKEPFKMVYLTSVAGFESRQVLNGDRAWTVIAGVDSVTESEPVEVAALRSGFGFDLPHLLLAAVDAKATVASIGRQKVGERDADAVSVVTAGGERRTLLFDPGTHRLLAVESRERGQGGLVVARRVYGDYRLFNGIQWPFSEERYLGGERFMTVTVNELQVNPPVSEVEFAQPTSKAPAKH